MKICSVQTTSQVQGGWTYTSKNYQKPCGNGEQFHWHQEDVGNKHVQSKDTFRSKGHVAHQIIQFTVPKFNMEPDNGHTYESLT